MREDRVRLVRFTYVGIPDFSVLVPPARVIVVRAREVHHLLHRRPLSAVFRWGAEYHEGKQVLLLDQLIDSGEIAVAIVVGPRHISLIRISAASTEGEGPSFFIQTG